jgi:hypothetical protein
MLLQPNKSTRICEAHLAQSETRNMKGTLTRDHYHGGNA